MENDESIYLKATQEAEGGGRIDALWAKSMALTDGDESKAKYKYIHLRVEQLKDLASRDEESLQNNSFEGIPSFEYESNFSVITDKVLRNRLENLDRLDPLDREILHGEHGISYKCVLASDYAKLHNVSYKAIQQLFSEGKLQGTTIDNEQYVLQPVDEHQALESDKTGIVSSPHAQKGGNLRPQRKEIFGYILRFVVAIAVVIVILIIVAAVFNIYGILLTEKLNSMENISEFKYVAIGLTKLIPWILGFWLVKLSWKKIMAK